MAAGFSLAGIGFACGSGPPSDPSEDGGTAGGADTRCATDVDGGCRCQFDGTSEGVCGKALIDPASGECREPDPYEGSESTCDDGLDNDCDGDADCADPDCTGETCGLGEGTAQCVGAECQETACGDGVDNDKDGKTDCEDSDCTNEVCDPGSDRTCPPPDVWESDESTCDDVDNDCDGSTDDWDDVSSLSARLLGTPDDDRGRSVATDGSGNVYVGGRIEGDVAGQTCNGGPFDGFLAKYDSTGRRLWVKLIGTSDGDAVRQVATDGSGNVYVVGLTAGNLGEQSNAGDADGFVARFDGSGNRQWIRLLGGSSRDALNAVAVGGGNVNVAGFAEGAVASNTHQGAGDAMIAQYDTSGNRNWVELTGTDRRDIGADIAADGSGGVYVAGPWGGDFTDPQTDTVLFLAKYDGMGVQSWDRVFGTSGANDAALGVATDGSGNPYVAGFTSGSVGGVVHSGRTDALVTKYDASGSRQWLELVGGSGADTALDLVEQGGTLYLTGTTRSSFLGQSPAGNGAPWLGVLSLSGTVQSANIFGTTEPEQGLGVAVDGSSTYVSGFTGGDLGDRTNSGRKDAFVTLVP